MRVLFLDIDGVLNGHDYSDEAKSCNIRRECVFRLNRVVKETGCKIVISSSWRYMVHGGQMTLTGFWYMLRTHGLVGHGPSLIIGVTRKDRDIEKDERGEQIRAFIGDWNKRNPGNTISQYAAIDDCDIGITKAKVPLVLTDGSKGMSDSDAERLIFLLGA